MKSKCVFLVILGAFLSGCFKGSMEHTKPMYAKQVLSENAGSNYVYTTST